MPNRVRDENVLSLKEAAKRLPHLRNDRPVHVSTIWRWKQRGLGGIKLECAKIGGQWVTSLEALERFFDAQEYLSPGSNRTNPAGPRTAKNTKDSPFQIKGQRQDEVAEELRRRFGM